MTYDLTPEIVQYQSDAVLACANALDYRLDEVDPALRPGLIFAALVLRNTVESFKLEYL